MWKNKTKLLISILLFAGITIWAGIKNPIWSKIFAAESIDAVLYSDGSLVFQKGISEDETHGSVVSTYQNVGTTKIVPWFSQADLIRSVYAKDVISPLYMTNWFYNCSNLKNADLRNIKTDQVTDMSGMFYGCCALGSLDVSSWNTKKVTNMDQMFGHCNNIRELDLSSFHTPVLTSAANIFSGMYALKILDLSHFNFSSLKSQFYLDTLTSIEQIKLNDSAKAEMFYGDWFLSNGRLWNSYAYVPSSFSIYSKNPLLKDYICKKISIDVDAFLDGKRLPSWSTPACGEQTYSFSVYDQDGRDICSLNNCNAIYAKGENKTVDFFLKEGTQYVIKPEFSYKSNYLVDLKGDLHFIAGSQEEIHLSITLNYQSVKSVKTHKVWDDDSMENIRPKQITVILYKDGAPYASELLGEFNNWTYIWTKLPVYDFDENGESQKIIWTVEEKIPVGYQESHSHLELTNAKPDDYYTNLILNKTWIDNENEKHSRGIVLAHLWKISGGNREEIDHVMIDCSYQQSAVMHLTTWKNLPLYDEDNQLVSYEITEDSMEGYQSSITYTESQGQTICMLKNTYTKQEEVPDDAKDIIVRKYWDDTIDYSLREPFEITVYDSGNDTVLAKKTVQPSVQNGYTSQDVLIRGLPQKDDDGNDIYYSVRESSKPFGYMTMYSSDGINYSPSYQGFDDNTVNGSKRSDQVPEASTGEAAFYIKNVLPESHRIQIEKSWREEDLTKRPDQLHLTLYGNLYNRGELIASNVAVGEIIWTNMQSANYNPLAAMRSSDFKPWNYLYCNKSGYHLSNGQAYAVILVNAASTFRYNGLNCLVEYSGIGEKNENGYHMYNAVLSSKSPNSGYYMGNDPNSVMYKTWEWDKVCRNQIGYNYMKIENEGDNTINYDIHKKWVDGNETHNPVKVKLMRKTGTGANYRAVSDQTVVLSEQNEWSYQWEDLPVYDSSQVLGNLSNNQQDMNNTRFTYRAFEVDDNEQLINIEEGQLKGPYSFGNRLYLVRYYKGEIQNYLARKIRYEKLWDDCDNADGSRKPVKIYLRYDQDGKSIVAAQNTLFQDQTGEFYVPYYNEEGDMISYYITEDALEGYESDISGNMEDGFMIRNHHNPTLVSFSIQKEWNDYDDFDHVRPESVEIQLYANEDLINTISLSESNEWKISLENLPVIDDEGKKIVYSLKEAEVPHYKSVISGSIQTGFVVHNSHDLNPVDEEWEITNKPETTDIKVIKQWDVTDNYDITAAAIHVQLYRQKLVDSADTKEYGPLEEVGGIVTLDSANGWEYVWKKQAKYYNEEPIRYFVEEVDEEGHSIIPSGMSKSIRQSDEYEFVIRNSSTKVQISKVNRKGEKLAGARLQIIKEYHGEKKIVAEWESDEEEYLLEGILQCGEDYILHEAVAPKGYSLAEDVSFTVGGSEEIKSLSIEDDRLWKLPNTGGAGEYKIWMFIGAFPPAFVLLGRKIKKILEKNQGK